MKNCIGLNPQSDYRNPFIAEAMKVFVHVNNFNRDIYMVQKKLQENGNGKAIFDFSFRTAFKVVENISKKYFEEGFGTNSQKTSRKHPEKQNHSTTNNQCNSRHDRIRSDWHSFWMHSFHKL